MITPILLRNHPSFHGLLGAVADEPLFIPEYTEEELNRFHEHGDGWLEALAADATEKVRSVSKRTALTSIETFEKVRESLSKRFMPDESPTRKDQLATIHDALVAVVTGARTCPMDPVSFDILSSWGAELLLCNESRYVHGFPPGRVIWITANINALDPDQEPRRRGLREFGPTIVEQIEKSYRILADQLCKDQNGSVRFPYIEIYKVRALTAFTLGVNYQLVDKVLAEIRDGIRPAHYRVELAVGTGRWQAVSEQPFRIGSSRYYIILVKPEEGERDDK